MGDAPTAPSVMPLPPTCPRTQLFPGPYPSLYGDDTCSDGGARLLPGDGPEHPLPQGVRDRLPAPPGDGDPELELELVGLDAVGALVEVLLDGRAALARQLTVQEPVEPGDGFLAPVVVLAVPFTHPDHLPGRVPVRTHTTSSGAPFFHGATCS